MKKSDYKETDLAKILIDMLTDWHWEVYQEVQYGGGRADIVAKRNKILWGIEVKKTANLHVIEQAYHLKDYCHYASVATPDYHRFFHRLCYQNGIGVLRVHPHGQSCDEDMRPRLNRKAIGITLYEEQKTFAEAGSNKGGHWTRFKNTKRNLIDAVLKTPGIEFNQLIKEIDHHYGSYSVVPFLSY